MKEKANKNVNMVKEVFILILLLILIMLVIAVSLYDFIPTDITVAEDISYLSDSTTTSIKQEIAYTNGGDISADADSTLVTSLKSYSIDASDLTVYSEKNLYNSGNSNPFEYGTEDTTDETSTDETSSGETSTSTSTTSSSSTTGTFFESSSSK